MNCNDGGNETKECIDECSVDGLTCRTKIVLDRCTCSKMHIMVTEVKIFDIQLRKSIGHVAPGSDKYGLGYVNECGNCMKYCKSWPGESKSTKSSTKYLSCNTSH
jgi:hypothetical protein